MKIDTRAGRIRLFVWFGLFVGSPLMAGAQYSPTPVPNTPSTVAADAATGAQIGPQNRAEILEAILGKLRQRYVSADVAATIERHLRTRMAQNAYRQYTAPATFAVAVTTDLQAISHDRHLVLWYSETPLPVTEQASWAALSPAEQARTAQELRGLNYGFRRIELLDGNIGYLDLAGFAPAGIAWDTATAAMQFLSASDALIIDVRENRGGSPEMVALLCSYLFDSQFKAVHLNDVYSRLDGEVHQFWTLPYVPGKRYVGKEVYILTSKRTFSSAEEFAYDLQAQRRVTVVGEATAGGAHMGAVERIDDHFSIFIPSGRSRNPVTKTSWEGTGVLPDRAVPAGLALKAARGLALRRLLEKATDSQMQRRYMALIDAIEREDGGR